MNQSPIRRGCALLVMSAIGFWSPRAAVAAPPASEYPPPVDPALSAPGPDHGWTWGIGSLTLVCAIASGALLGLAAAADRDLAAELDDTESANGLGDVVAGTTQYRAYSERDRIDRLELSGWILLGVAGASALATLIVGLTRDGTASDPDVAPEPYRAQWSPRFYVDPARGDAGMGVELQF